MDKNVKKSAGKKIIVGMSSGVDSSVAAAILKKNGWETRGVFLRLYNDKEKNKKNAEDVKTVCEKIGIPLKIIDVRRRFKNTVVKYFLKEYEMGNTPNPCVFCNENLKFKILFEEARKIKADYVATGHYARLRREFLISNFSAKGGSASGGQFSNKLKIQNSKTKKRYKLLEAKDKNKDQSYFLYRLKQKQLAKIIFPIGELKKIEVRRLARDFNLPVSEKKESQDICFLRNTSVEEFLRKNIKMKKGDIFDEKGRVVGRHNGLATYTIGQRRGINIGGRGPYYVIGKDEKKNALFISNEKKPLALYKNEIGLESANWVLGEPDFSKKVFLRTRFRNSLISATIKSQMRANKKQANSREFVVKFEEPQRAVANGQSAVFYGKKGEVIGGGIIN